MEVWKNCELNDLEGEIWKDIKDYEKCYQISNYGRVKSIPGARKWVHDIRILKQKLSKGGYPVVSFYKNGSKGKFYTVHRLVAQEFIPNPNNKPYVNHKDSNRTNNMLDNLEWVSHGENMKHGFLFGHKSQKGEKNNQAKITIEIAYKIRDLYKTGLYTQKEIGEIMGLTRCHIKDIVNNKIWNY